MEAGTFVVGEFFTQSVGDEAMHMADYEKRREEGASEEQLIEINSHALDYCIESGYICFADVGFPGQTTGGGAGKSMKVPEKELKTLDKDLVKEYHGFVDQQTAIKNKLVTDKTYKNEDLSHL